MQGGKNACLLKNELQNLSGKGLGDFCQIMALVSWKVFCGVLKLLHNLGEFHSEGVLILDGKQLANFLVHHCCSLSYLSSLLHFWLAIWIFVFLVESHQFPDHVWQLKIELNGAFKQFFSYQHVSSTSGFFNICSLVKWNEFSEFNRLNPFDMSTEKKRFGHSVLRQKSFFNCHSKLSLTNISNTKRLSYIKVQINEFRLLLKQ